jgi:hypothetical protein
VQCRPVFSGRKGFKIDPLDWIALHTSREGTGALESSASGGVLSHERAVKQYLHCL